MSNPVPTHTSALLWKRINWDLLSGRRSEYDNNFYHRTKEFPSSFVVSEPIKSFPDEWVLQRLVYADFLARYTWCPFVTSVNPSFSYNLQSDNEFFVRNRQDIVSQIRKRLNSFSIATASLATSLDNHILVQSNELTGKLFDQHRIAHRYDVAYYNIYTHTVIPDHRIQYKVQEWTRYYIRFFVDSKKDTIIAPLDHPYLLFGCVAIVVHPDDKRYKKFVGQNVLIPLINKSVPVIAHTSVSMEWTGARILLPAHQRTDFLLALELWLPYTVYSVDHNGCFTSEAKEFQGKHKDVFETNIIQFVDDIFNIEKRETVKMSIPVDAHTGDILVPLLQRNVYLSLTDGSLQDQSLCKGEIMYTGDVQRLQSQIEQDERRCISTTDRSQMFLPFFAYPQQSELMSDFSSKRPLLFVLLRDMMLLGLLSFPAKIEHIVQALSTFSEGEIVYSKLLTWYQSLYSSQEVDQLRTILDFLSQDVIDNYDSVIEQFIVQLDQLTDMLPYTQQWYVLWATVPYHYDAEYLSLLISHHTLFSYEWAVSSSISLVYTEEYADWIKYMLYLYRLIHTTSYSGSLHAISLPQSSYTLSLEQLQWYPDDVARLYLLAYVSPHTIPQVGAQSFDLDTLQRLINKVWNAFRILWWSVYDTTTAGNIEFLHEEYMKSVESFSEYDIWIITRLHYIYDEVIYYSNKYDITQSLTILLEFLRYDVSEYRMFLTKYHYTSQSLFVNRLIIIVSLHLLYPFAPTSSLWFAGLVWLELKSDVVANFFTTLSLQKNYHCTMMMDALYQRHIMLEKNTKTSFSCDLLIQTNKDFYSYIESHKDLIYTYLGVDKTMNFYYLNENEQFPDTIDYKDILTTKVWVRFHDSTESSKMTSDTTTVTSPLTTSSLTTFQGQLQYKQQLLQTVRNTITRLRSNPWSSQQTLISLQSNVEELLSDIESLEYEISKIKYF